MESESDSPESKHSLDEKADLPQSFAFTVHFDTGKPNNGAEMPSKFARKHIRNLSLPISKVYESKVSFILYSVLTYSKKQRLTENIFSSFH